MGRWRRRGQGGGGGGRQHKPGQHTSPGHQVSFGPGSNGDFEQSNQAENGDEAHHVSNTAAAPHGPNAGRKNYGRRGKGKSGTRRHQAAFNDRDKERIRSYLVEYRDRAEKHCFHEPESEHESDANENAPDENLAPAVGVPEVVSGSVTDIDVKQGGEDGENAQDEKQDIYLSPITIARHIFPALSPSVLSAPYLSLPTTLSPKQRKLVHELCVDVGLYHSGAGTRSGGDRRVVISIHYDGLDHVPNLSKPVSVPVERCLPWYYRNDHVGLEADGAAAVAAEGGEGGAEARGGASDVGGVAPSTSEPSLSGESVDTPVRSNSSSSSVKSGGAADDIAAKNDATNGDNAQTRLVNLNRKHVLEATLQGRRAIESLIDQPGRCLRDAHDAIDFSEWEGQDLSEDQVLPNPTPEEASVWMLVNTPEKMEQCVTEINTSHPSEIGLDLECYNRSKFQQTTCLVQLHVDGKDYVIDVLAPGVWDAVSLLQPIFADPSIVKIGHSVTGTDVPSLHRDFGIFIVNCFDTYEAAKALRLRKQNLAGLCEHYGLSTSEEYAALKQEYQNTDWRRRPLTEPMVRYGRYDCRFLVKLRMLLIRDLTRAELWDRTVTDTEVEARIVASALAAMLSSPLRDEDEGDGSSAGGYSRQSSTISDDGGYFTGLESDESFDDMEGDSSNARTKSKRSSIYSAKELRMHAGLMRVIGLSQEACLKLWKDPREYATKNDAFISILKRSAYGTVHWDDGHTALYEKLARWRESVAKREGTYPGAVCTLDLLVNVARTRPTCKYTMRKIEFYLPALLEDEERGYSSEMLSIVRSSLIDNGSAAGGPETTVIVRSYKERVVLRETKITKENGGTKEKQRDEEENNTRTSRPVNEEKISHMSAGKSGGGMASTKRVVGLALAAATVGLVAIVVLGKIKRRK